MMNKNTIYKCVSVGLLIGGLVSTAGCSKSPRGIKSYLGMKDSPSKEFRRKYPGTTAARAKDVQLPALSARQTAAPAPSAYPAAAATVRQGSVSMAVVAAAQKITEKISERFPKAEGYVVEVKNEQVYLNLGEGEGIKEGALLDLIRKGREFKHPYTGKVLGYFEENIGALKITQVKENYCVAEVVSLNNGIEVRKGDMGRISADKIKLAVLPFFSRDKETDVDEESMTAELYKALKRSSRFNLYDPDTLKVWMLEHGLKPEDLSREAKVKKVMQGIPSEWYLVNSVRELQGVKVIESRLISSHYDEPIAVANAVLEEAKPREAAPAYVPPQTTAAPAYQAQVRRQVLPRARVQGTAAARKTPRGKRAVFQGKYWTSKKFNFEIVGLDVGDVDGDGKNELVLAGKDRIEILKWDGADFKSIHTYTSAKGSNYFISVDLADINGNGVDEIYVSNFVDEEVRSFVLEVRGNKLIVLKHDLFQLFRVADLPGQEPILLSQWVNPGPTGPIFGKIEKYEWKGKKLKKARLDGALKNIPRKFNIYSIALGDLNRDGIEDVLTLSDDGKIGLYDRKGEQVWGSSDTYGGRIIRSRGQTKMFDPQEDVTDEYRKNMSPVNQRMLLSDLSGDEKPELIVPNNMHAMGGAFKSMGGYSNSYLVGLSWNGVTLVEDWQTAKTGGYITDIYMKDVDNDGQDELVAAVAFKAGYLGLGRQSAVYVFEFLWQ